MTDSEKTTSRFRTVDLAYIALFAVLMAVCAWITIPIPKPFVQFTLQTFAVFMALITLGGRRGLYVTVVYLLMGAVGVPVFSGFKSGIGALMGSTGGYIIGFIFTALIVGYISDKTGGKLWCVVLGMIAGVLACYVFGTAWFAVVYAKTSEPAPLATILGWCVFPFLIPDAVKIGVAAVLANRLKRFVK